MTVAANAIGVGGSGMYQWSVELTGYVSSETGKAPNAYLWVPDGCKEVKAVILAQQNMTEEAIFKMPSFQKRMAKLNVALLWVAPAFSNNWDPQTPCQSVFDDMMTAIAYQSNHLELQKAPVIPLGHSAQATFPWNFAAWNPDRTLCIISFLADTGRGHFDCGEPTADYLAKFIEKSMQQRLQPDGTLKRLNPKDGWLADRFRADLPQNDGSSQGTMSAIDSPHAQPAPYTEYKGDRHDAFWYLDREMAQLADQRHQQSRGKRLQYVGFEQQGRLIPYNEKLQGGMEADFVVNKDGVTMHLRAVYTDSTHLNKSSMHAKNTPHIEVICGPLKKVSDTTFRIYPYEAGWDNPRRSRVAWLVAVGDSDGEYRGCVQPIKIKLPDTMLK